MHSFVVPDAYNGLINDANRSCASSQIEFILMIVMMIIAVARAPPALGRDACGGRPAEATAAPFCFYYSAF